MNCATVVIRFSLAILFLSLALLLIGSLLAITNMQTLAQTYNNNSVLSSNNNNTLNVGFPQKETFPLNSHSPILSHGKKGGVDIGHSHSPPLPSSGKSIQGPIPGTQTP
jgi:hypothetical protein